MKRLFWCVFAILAVQGLAVVLCMSLLVHKGLSVREQPTAAEVHLARLLRRLAVPGHALALSNPLTPTAEVIAKARAHFADHCAGCHGNDGRGRTSIGMNLYPKAPDMTLAATQSMSDGEIFYTIKHGIRLTGMPAWGADTPQDDEASWGLVHFIRHLPDVTPVELSAMEKLNPKTPAEFRQMEAEERFLEGR